MLIQSDSKLCPILVLFFLSGPAFSATGGSAGPKVTLDDAYRAAVTKTETVPIQNQLIAQTQERITQAQSGYYPSLGASATYFHLGTSNPSQTNTIQATSTSKVSQTIVRVGASQSVFRGLRDYYSVKTAEFNNSAQQEQQRQVEVSTFANVSQNFFSVLATEADLQNLKTQLDLSVQRVKELQARVKIGRSRETEVLTLQSQIESLQAQIEASRTQLAQLRQTFTLFTGLDGNSTLIDSPEMPKNLPTVDYYLKQLEARPDIRSLVDQVQAAETSIGISRSGHLPSIDLNGNYYLVRSGTNDNTVWDFTGTLSFPIFQGGLVRSQVREAAARQHERELTLAQTRRTAQRDIQVNLQSAVSAIQQAAILEKAVAAAERNYQQQNRDYRLGLVTNLDVLQALNSFQDIKRSLDRTRYNAKASLAALNAAVGKTSLGDTN